jgi:Uma2 family endonuclease
MSIMGSDYEKAMFEKAIAPLKAMTLISDDGVPLESDWHRSCMNLLIDLVHMLHRGRLDYYTGGNMFIYFSTQRVFNADFRGPDFFYVRDVPLDPPRPYWATWEEGGHFPDVIIELLSPTTARLDRTVKKDLYEQTFRTRDYFCFDPDTGLLEGWTLDANGRYQPLPPNAEGRLWCSVLNVWVGTWSGVFQAQDRVWVRFFDQQGRLVPTPVESEQERTEAERRRAEELEAEVKRLRALLEQQQPPRNQEGGTAG